MSISYKLRAKISLLISCGLIGFVSAVQASKLAEEDIFTLSLEALGDIKVASSSVSEKTLSRAPNVISVITAERIQASGAQTLSELLHYLPGVQVLQRRNGRDMLWIRGIPSGRNTKTLLLIDGVPQNETIFGGWSPDETVRVDNIARIELIRGPGSALYGGNAYAGVVSIVTKNAEANDFAAVFQGKFQTIGSEFGISAEKSDIKYRISGRTYDTKGHPQIYDRSGNASNHYNNVDAVNGQIKVSADKWMVDYRYDNYMTEYPMYASGDYKSQRYTSNNFLGQLAHEYADIQLKHTLFFNSVNRVFDRDAFKEDDPRLFFSSDSQLSSRRYGLKSYALINNSDTLQTSLGLFIDKWHVSEYYETIFVQNYQPVERLLSGLRQGEDSTPSAENYAGLWQQDLQLFDRKMELILGLRYDYHSIFGDKISTRFGMTWQSDKKWSVKLLWGSAYRPPTFLQQYEIRSDNNVPGNPDIEPETIKTSEFEFSYYYSANQTASARLFSSELKNFIQSIDGGQYQNTDDERRVEGAELEWRQAVTLENRLFDKMSFDVNYTFLDTKQASIARNVLNTQLTFESEKYTLFFALNALSKRNPSETYHNRVRNPLLVNADNKRATLEASVNFQVKAFILPNLTLGAKITNFGDVNRYNPTYAPDGYYDVKGKPRYYEVKLTYAF